VRTAGLFNGHTAISNVEEARPEVNKATILCDGEVRWFFKLLHESLAEKRTSCVAISLV
jgi:hypothetical protein